MMQNSSTFTTIFCVNKCHFPYDKQKKKRIKCLKNHLDIFYCLEQFFVLCNGNFFYNINGWLGKVINYDVLTHHTPGNTAFRPEQFIITNIIE
jgi:hypothetical protein